MSDLNKGNKGFLLMLPKAKKEEVTERNITDIKIEFTLFKWTFRFSFKITSPD